MSSLLSFARAGPAHRASHDEEAAVATSSANSQRPSRWSLPFGIGSTSGNRQALAVEMSSQPVATAANANNSNNNVNLDIEQGQARHERGASGRSILSAVSIPSLSHLRQRDRDQERRRQDARVQAEGGTLASLGVGNPLAPILLSQPSASASRTANKKSRSSRREREEAATLFGPNLANYFGSGVSSSGAVSSHGAGVPQPAAVASPASPVTAPSPALPSSPQAAHDLAGSQAIDSATGSSTMDTSYPQNAFNSRRARLGSRGRARGASLSGLSIMSLGAESVTSLGGINTERTVDTTQATGMMQGSTADLIDQLNRDASSVGGPIAMSEGIDIGTLQRWIQRSSGVTSPDAPADAALSAPAACGPPVCTTLQSFVNLKRNTLKLSTTASTSTKSDSVGGKASEIAADANILRSRSSLSVLPTLSYGSTSVAATPAGRDLLPEPTHSLYFEYDCAAPYASVQIFIRASRKHGSWLNWTPPAETGAHPLSSQTNADGSQAWLAQCGPPPHVLGWPVHVAKLKKGFGSGHTANIPLHLQYYAPPKAKKADRNSAAIATGGDTSDKDASVKRALSFKRVPEPPTPAAIPETPGFEFNRRLEMDADDADEDAANTNARGTSGAAARAESGSRADAAAAGAATTDHGAPSLAIEGLVAQPVIEEETKEQRLAREKAERETLKLAIVVEALDENARPLREPNLQTSYLRLTSLPVKKPIAGRLAEIAGEAVGGPEPPRTWSSQMEGQEAEIGPHRFQLQELYGLSSKPPAVAPVAVEGADADDDAAVAPPPPPMDLDASNGSECLICLSSPPTTLLLPCTHGLCLECAVQLRDSVVGIRQSERRRGRTPRRKYACPVCRRAYTSMLHLSKADEKVIAQQSV